MAVEGSARIGVFGSTGSLGGMVAARLAALGVRQRLVVREAARAPRLDHAQVAEASYMDRSAMVSALHGISTVFFVSGRESADRLLHHRAAVDALLEAGVERVVYTSFLGAAPDAVFTLARDHFYTEQYLESAGLRFSALRNSLYQDVLPDLVDGGVIRGPAGTGRFAPVSRADIADVAVALLLDDNQPTARFDVTGPELLTMGEVADLLGEAAGSSVAFVNETLVEAYASRARFDVPGFEIEGWVTSYRAIAVGELAIASDAVESIAGRPPMSLRACLQAPNLTSSTRWPGNQVGGDAQGNGGRSRRPTCTGGRVPRSRFPVKVNTPSLLRSVHARA